MARDGQPNLPVNLEPLDAYQMSGNAPANSMGLSDLDGFLTGMAPLFDAAPLSEEVIEGLLTACGEIPTDAIAAVYEF